jgi:hypothetical protein
LFLSSLICLPGVVLALQRLGRWTGYLHKPYTASFAQVGLYGMEMAPLWLGVWIHGLAKHLALL